MTVSRTAGDKELIEKNTSRLEKDGPVATITFTRPERRNALDTEVFEDLYESLWDCEHDDAIRIVVLTGEGPVFCAGQNLKFTSTSPTEVVQR